MRQLIAILFLLSASIYAYGQGTVTGRVVDAQNGEGLPGATLKEEGSTSGTITDVNGKFNLRVSQRQATILISYVGYIDQKVEVTVDGEASAGTVELKPDAIGLNEVKVLASFAKDRETPVSVSTIQPIMIEEKLGTQEFPEILKSTPSVYVTKQGGGFGDSRINLRGFDSNNIGVLINGVPVNDMESGRVYWSNWAGLSDVTRTMQVQRGLGASKLAISSVGGTINILTQTTDAEAGGSIYQGIGNNGYSKTSFSLSTGLMDNGWAVSLSGSRTTGDGYVEATPFDAYSYFFNISKRINNDHSLALTGFGAPQTHSQRSSMHPINFYRQDENGIQANTDYGYRNGEIYSTGYAFNKYHKPQFMLNHHWQVNDFTNLSTAVYSSFGEGYGRRVTGDNDKWLEFQYPSGKPYEETQRTPEGLLDYDAVIEANAASPTGSKAIMTNGYNSHDWYGLLSSFNTAIGKTQITAGVDGRYYIGYHYTEIEDLLGGDYFLDNADVNRSPGTPLYKGDKISYYNLGEVAWGGGFLQTEYVSDLFSAFISGSASTKHYRRVDYFNYEEGNQKSDWVDFLTYSAKGGVNYNFTDKMNIFANGGYFTRAPYFNTMFVNYRNDINEGAKVQRVMSAELGYGYLSSKLKVDLTAYHTRWLDKTLTQSLGQVTANLTGLNAIHQGIEFEARYKPTSKINFKAMVSVGDWQWEDNVEAGIFDEDQNLLDSISVYAKGIHVSNAAQTTAAFSATAWVLPDVKVGLDFNHFDRLFAAFDIEDKTSEDEEGVDAWQLPDYQLLDMNVRYDFDLIGFDATLYGKVNNLLDTEYIADARDGSKHNASTSYVWYGFGRTWSMSLKLRF